MKPIRFGSACLVLALSACGAAQDHETPGHAGHERPRQDLAGPCVGAEVRDFTLTDNSGAAFRLGSLRRAAVLTFWCTTCVSCRVIEKDFDRKAREYGDRGISFLMVDSNVGDSAERVNAFLKKNALSFPVVLDPESEVAGYFGATRTTTTAVIDAQGRLRYYGGFRKAEDAVRDLMACRDVAVPESPASG